MSNESDTTAAAPSAPLKRVEMVRKVAQRWVESQVRSEIRLQIFGTGKKLSVLARLLKSFRDGKIRIGSVDPILDLGMRVDFDSVTVWAADRQAMLRLNTWLEGHGYETTGVW